MPNWCRISCRIVRSSACTILVAIRSAARGELYDTAMTEAVRYPAAVYWFSATVFFDSDKAD
jgi:hypothetical protein